MGEETKWIRQIKRKSNQDAANKLISGYYKEIYAYVYKQTMNKDLSMDLTQEIFISVLQSINSFNERKASFRTWLYKLSTYRIIDYYRSKHYKMNQTIVPMQEEGLHHNEDFTIQFEHKQDVEDIVQIVNRFDTITQQIFRLKFFAEYTFLEISSSLNVPESTVKTRYYAMIKKIKRALEVE